MTRETWVYRDGKMVLRGSDEERATRRHHVISDNIELLHPVTGQVVTSKRKFSQITREAGCIEVGNEKFPERRREDASAVRNDVGEAMRAYAQGYRNAPLDRLSGDARFFK